MSRNSVERQEYEWKEVPWQELERRVFKLQKRIYRAAQEGNKQKVRKLQGLLNRSWSAKMIAVCQVTQQNQGKKTVFPIDDSFLGDVKVRATALRPIPSLLALRTWIIRLQGVRRPAKWPRFHCSKCHTPGNGGWCATVVLSLREGGEAVPLHSHNRDNTARIVP